MQSSAQIRSECAVRHAAEHRWAIILAGGGEGPRQFRQVFGADILPDETVRRVGNIVAADRIFTVVTKAHEVYYGVPRFRSRSEKLLIQPCDRGSTPAILYGIVGLLESDPDAVVGIFPSDLYFSDHGVFSDCVREAYEFAELSSESVILLGMKPNRPETECAWIEPGDSLLETESGRICRVRHVWEKPSRSAAAEFMQRGYVWSSFIMVGRVSAFLELVGHAAPELLRSFRAIAPVYFTQIEEATVLDLYRGLPYSGFSRDVLSVCPGNLAVLCNSTLESADITRVESALESGPATLQQKTFLPIERSLS